MWENESVLKPSGVGLDVKDKGEAASQYGHFIPGSGGLIPTYAREQ